VFGVAGLFRPLLLSSELVICNPFFLD